MELFVNSIIKLGTYLANNPKSGGVACIILLLFVYASNLEGTLNFNYDTILIGERVTLKKDEAINLDKDVTLKLMDVPGEYTCSYRREGQEVTLKAGYDRPDRFAGYEVLFASSNLGKSTCTVFVRSTFSRWLEDLI